MCHRPPLGDPQALQQHDAQQHQDEQREHNCDGYCRPNTVYGLELHL